MVQTLFQTAFWVDFIQKIKGGHLFRQLSWYTLASLTVQISSFVSAVVVSRYLGPTNLGLYSFVQNYVGTVLTIIAGMDFYFVWKLARSDNYQKDIKLFVGYKFYMYVVLGIGGAICAYIVLPHDVFNMVMIMLVPACIQSLNIFGYYAMATDRAKLVAMSQIIVALTLVGIKVVLVLLQAPLYTFVYVAALDLILSGIIMSAYFLGNKSWRSEFVRYPFPSLWESVTFVYSIKTSIVAIMLWQLLLRIDQLILATFSKAYVLGIYAAAVKIAEVPNFLAGVLSTALISRMASIAKEDSAEGDRKEKMIMRAYLVVGIGIAVCTIIFAPLAVKIIYGTKFLESASVLQVYALSIPGLFLNYFFLGRYGARERYTTQVFIFGCAVALNVVLIYILNPLYGVKGVAFATAFAYTISALLFYLKLEKRI